MKDPLSRHESVSRTVSVTLQSVHGLDRELWHKDKEQEQVTGYLSVGLTLRSGAMYMAQSVSRIVEQYQAMNQYQGYQWVSRLSMSLKAMNQYQGYQWVSRLWTNIKAINESQGYQWVSRLWTHIKAMNQYQDSLMIQISVIEYEWQWVFQFRCVFKRDPRWSKQVW